jgi:uncharacterized membrane protein
MQSRTTYLSKLIGWYLLLFALAMFLNKPFIVASVAALIQEPPLVLVLGLVVVAAGIALILAHNVWSGGPQAVIVTLIGWASLFKGLVLLFFTPSALQAYFAAFHYAQLFYVFASVTLVLGAYLLFSGYRARTG